MDLQRREIDRFVYEQVDRRGDPRAVVRDGRDREPFVQCRFQLRADFREPVACIDDDAFRRRDAEGQVGESPHRLQ